MTPSNGNPLFRNPEAASGGEHWPRWPRRRLVCRQNRFSRNSASCKDTARFATNFCQRVFGDAGDVEHRLRAMQISLSLLELLVQLRRFDFRQQLSLLHVRADIDMPRFEYPLVRA